jgi:hypothetical protein
VEYWFSVQQVGNLGSLLLGAGLLAAALLALGLMLLAQDLRMRADAAFWRLLAMVLLLLAADSLAEGELLLGGWLREQAQLGHWYEWRRALQLGVLLAGLWLAALLWRWLMRWLARLQQPLAPRRALLGLLLLLAVPVLRGVSFHYTDALLYWPLVGVGLGRWAEFLGLLLLVRAGWLQWQGFVVLQRYRA